MSGYHLRWIGSRDGSRCRSWREHAGLLLKRKDGHLRRSWLRHAREGIRNRSRYSKSILPLTVSAPTRLRNAPRPINRNFRSTDMFRSSQKHHRIRHHIWRSDQRRHAILIDLRSLKPLTLRIKLYLAVLIDIRRRPTGHYGITSDSVGTMHPGCRAGEAEQAVFGDGVRCAC